MARYESNIIPVILIAGMLLVVWFIIPGLGRPASENVAEMSIMVVYEDGSSEKITSGQFNIIARLYGLDSLITSSGKRIKEIVVTLVARVRAETGKRIVNAKWYCRGVMWISYQYGSKKWIRVYETDIPKDRSGPYPISKLDGSEYTVFTRTYKADTIIQIIKDRIGGIPSGSKVKIEFLIPAYTDTGRDSEPWGLKITATLEDGEELTAYNNNKLYGVVELTYTTDRLY